MLGVEDNANYVYAVVFMVFGNTYSETTEMDFSFKVGTEKKYSVQLSNGGQTYIIIPCDYYRSTATVSIENKGTEDLLIKDFDYIVIDGTKESYTYSTTIRAHKLTSTTTHSRSGYYSKIEYDSKQRVIEETNKTIAQGANISTTEYSYYDETSATTAQKGKIKNITTTDYDGAVEQTNYEYAGDWNNYTQKVTTVKGEQKMQSAYNINRASKRVCDVTQTDENGLQTIERYSMQNGNLRVSQVEYANTIEKYTYNDFGQVTTVEMLDRTTEELMMSQTDNYDNNGVYVGSSYAGSQYTFGYDNTGFVTSINKGQTPLLQYQYYENTQSLGSNSVQTKTYANGNVENYIYSELVGSTASYRTQIEYKNTANVSTAGTYTYNYNADKELLNQTYKVGITNKVSYEYGDLSNLEERKLIIRNLPFYTEYTKNIDTVMNRITHASLYNIIDCTTTDTKNITYGYGANGNISSVKYVGYLTDYTYDTFNRLNNRKVGVGYTTIVNENYVYKTYEQDEQTYTTKTLAVIDDQTSANRDRTATYDSNGYITEISYNGENYYYDYDGAGRIKTESYNNQIINYTYDAYNNVQKTGLVYTNGILSSANGATISYDDMGNPTTYKGNTFTWEQGRKLVAGSMNGKTFTYAYDGNGMRFEKVVNGVKTNYYYDGSQLLMESTNNKRIWYIYGVTGIEGLIVEEHLGDNHYYFDKNTLGDIVAIRDEDGYIVATYSYDAWGNAKVMNANGTENTSSTFIGNINPYRYRGYYYDKETGFYYLQTRYYDPTICRFINADNYELIAQLSTVVGQLNMYSYCGNNPIMCTDESGEAFFIAYIAALIMSIWDADVRADMNAIGWNPFNTNADLAARATKISFYKGSAVISQNLIGTCAAFGTIWKNSNRPTKGIDIQHEYGHNIQEMILGIFYWPCVVIPSVINYHIGDYLNYEEELRDKMYYSKIWERTADWLGGVNRNNYYNFWNINNFIFW